MLTAVRHPGCLSVRAVGLGALFLRAVLDWWRSPECRAEGPGGHFRAAWQARQSRRLLKILNVRTEWIGPRPDRGLLVANHLGYLDIPVLAAAAPTTFVAKSDVRHWPVFGRFAQMAGTVWVERANRQATGRTVTEIGAILEKGALVALFPEGTSSGGESVLDFKPALLEPACQSHHVWAAHVRYELDAGSVADEVAYWGDDTFLPHLLNLMTKGEVRARVRCARVPVTTIDRKQLARQLQSAVGRLGDGQVPEDCFGTAQAQHDPALDPVVTPGVGLPI